MQAPNTNTGKQPVVLIVDDEDPILKLLARQLEEVAAKIIPTLSPAEAIHLLQSMEVAVLLCDLNMPEISGNAVLHTAREANPNIVSIVVTGGAEMAATIKAINEGGIWKYISKPWRQDELVALVKSALSRYETLCHQQEKLKDLALDVKAETRRLASREGVKKKPAPASATTPAAETPAAPSGETPPAPAEKKQIRIVKKTPDGSSAGTTVKTLKVIKISGGKTPDKRPRSERYASAFQSTRYKLGPVIGESPLGVVYRAEDTLLSGPVVIKILGRNYTQDAAALAGFQERARQAMQLSHKHIVRLHGVEQNGERHFLVMELVDGQSFKDVLKLYRKLPPQTALQIGRVGASAIACAHRLSFVHGDIKPSNLLLTGDGVLKITDFVDSHLADLFKDTRAASSLLYMSPERVRGDALDGRADIYSLAMVLYELITGELPFPDEIDDLSLLEKGPTRFVPLPDGLDDIFRRALAPDREQRWASMDDFSRAFMEHVS